MSQQRRGIDTSSLIEPSESQPLQIGTGVLLNPTISVNTVTLAFYSTSRGVDVYLETSVFFSHHLYCFVW